MQTKPGWFYMWTRNPRNVAKLKRLRNHINLWFGYSLVTTAFLVWAGYEVGMRAFDNAVVAARRAAYAQAKADFEAEHKKRLSSDQEYVNQVCTTWWFVMTTDQRVITNKGKKR
jgi:hypothetical protein